MSWQGQLLRYYFISSPSQSLTPALDSMLQSLSLLNQGDLFLPFCHRVDPEPDVQHTWAQRNAFGLDIKNLRP